MKIVMFIYSMQCGGAERVTANLANEWSAHGWEVSVVSIASAKDDFYPLNAGIRRISLNLSGASRSFSTSVTSNLQRLMALRRLLRELSPDVVVGVMTTASVLAILARLGLPCRVIATEHTHPPRLPLNVLWRNLRRCTFRFSDCVVALTTDSKRWLEEHCNCANVKVIPPPFTWPIARTEPVVPPESVISAKRKVLLAAGRLSKEKGFDVLIAAFASIARPLSQWDLVIVGEGSDRSALENQIESLGLEGRIFLAGRVGNVSDWYERADLFVLSSRYEGLPMTLVEAMASGCAAVSYDCDTGPRDIITHGDNGLLVRSVGDPDELADALNALMSRDHVREQMASRATAVAETFSGSRTMALWRQILEKTV
ncbi:glycosyltransferase [Paraburkholderia sp. CNPSo 3157]|uniref:Glycosyltransferase n=1 Tax=Paraburkholderia franconis TaxID=2654983 RepID=A0A7X1N8N4_9BURK|nr:glycosyltransferase family 4 protein [Paraburkholderia franconis]MPW17418.1 glycosyltransferase [Paraburkholderia franconis]